MTKQNEIQKKIEQLQMELDTLAPIDKLTAREFAELSGVSPATATRLKNGDHDFNVTTLKKALPHLATCPCCGKEVERTPQAEDS